jgi:hypothetical protein
MIVKGLIDEDFVNYKKPCMVVMFPRCTFKCDKECGERVCQNGTLATAPQIGIAPRDIVERYVNNPITSAIVMSGLEPFDSFGDLSYLLHVIRNEYNCYDDVVIYTGYTQDEIAKKIEIICPYKNIVVKFGRFIPNQPPHYDDVLGIMLASDNQYGEKIS